MRDLQVLLIVFIVTPFATQAPVKFSSKPIVWIYGAPGAGKTSIADKFNFTRVSPGEYLRAEVKSGSKRARALAAVMQRGEIVSNDIILEVIKEAMEANFANSNGFIIDGFPRDEIQGDAFEKIIGPPNVILYLEASPETLKRRLLQRGSRTVHRDDDNEETINFRLKTFLDNNDKIQAKYPNMVRINADRSIDETFADVEKILDETLKRQTNTSRS